MRWRRVVGIVAGWWLAGPALAAGIDCAKARTATEHAICADADLMVRDRALANAYAVALARWPAPGELKDDQRAWLRVRDRCGGDASCLRPTLALRLQAVRAIGRRFRWAGQWGRNTLAPQTSSATLVIDKVSARGFAFSLQLTDGVDMGSVEGQANFIDAPHAVFRGEDAEGDGPPCVLHFRRQAAMVEVEQDVESVHSPACGTGAGIPYAGEYLADTGGDNDGAADATVPDLWTRGVLADRSQDQALQRLLGRDDYAQLVATAGSVDTQAPDLDHRGARVIVMFVRGIACDTKATIMLGPAHQLWVGLWTPTSDDKPIDELRYYTNVTEDKKRLPKTLEVDKAPCEGETLKVRYMP